MSKAHLTSQLIKQFACPDGKAKCDLFDSNCKGLMLEVRRSGHKTYYLRYQNQRGRTRQLKIADERDVTLSQARQLADGLRNKIAMGDDPMEEKAVLRQVPTFAQFIEEQYLPYVRTYKRSWDCDVSLLKNHLMPRFAKRAMDTIKRQDIVKMHHDRRAAGAAPGSANRLLILMRYVFNLAIKWDVPGIKANLINHCLLLRNQGR